MDKGRNAHKSLFLSDIVPIANRDSFGSSIAGQSQWYSVFCQKEGKLWKVSGGYRTKNFVDVSLRGKRKRSVPLIF